MSDYMFILESHLTPEQNAVLNAVQTAAAAANLSLFLTGGAMRDMLGGFPIRDLDFTVEGPAVKLAKDIVKKSGAQIVSSDDQTKSVELRFPSGGRCEIGMARQEKYGKPGSKPQVSPATIHEDLRGRDFTMNAIALSLNRASRGLMVDPTNGASDIERKEIRSCSNFGLYDDPIRILRLQRFKARLSYVIDEKTLNQYRNAREAEMLKYVQPRALFSELRQIALETNPDEVLRVLDEEGLLTLFCPGLTGAKVNLPTFQKLTKAKAMIPFGANLTVDWYALTMWCLTKLLGAKERAALVSNTKMQKDEIDPWQKLEARSKKLETSLKSAKLSKGSLVYHALKSAAGEEIFFLYLQSSQRIVQDRIKNYFTKYLPTAIEVTDAEVTEVSGLEPTHAKFAKAREERIAAHLDGRVRKPAPPPPEPVPEPQPAAARGRGMGRGMRRIAG